MKALKGTLEGKRFSDMDWQLHLYKFLAKYLDLNFEILNDSKRWFHRKVEYEVSGEEDKLKVFRSRVE